MLRVGSLKVVLDGGILIGTALLREPYGEHTEIYGYKDPDYRGVQAVPPVAQAPSSATVLNISVDEFLPVKVFADTAWTDLFWGGLRMTGSQASYWHAGFHVPNGATITGLDLTVDPQGQSGGVLCRIVRYRAIPGDSTVYPDPVTGGAGGGIPGTQAQLVASTATATGNGIQVVSSPAVSHVVDELGWNYRVAFLNMVPNGAILFGARVGYTPPAAAGGGSGGPVFLNAPTRAYDSRPGLAPLTGIKTPFIDGTVRTISCAVGGVPSNARGVIINLTATGTSANGFARAYPAGGALPGTSSLNWAGGQTVANSAIVACGANSSINIQVLSSTADIVVDVAGYFL